MNTKGFTLIELIFTLITLLLVTLITGKTIHYLHSKNEQQMLIDELKAIIQFSKTQAIIRGHTLFLVPLGSPSNWSAGVSLKQQSNDKSEQIYQWQWHYPTWLIQWKGVNTNRVVFSNTPAHAISNGKFILTNLQSQKHLEIIVNRLGRVKIS